MGKAVDRRRILQAAAVLGAALGAGVTGRGAAAQPAPGGGGPAGRAREALAEPFVGLTTGGKVRGGLFSIGKTGFSTAPVVEAACRLIESLNEAQRGRILFPVEDSEWRNWANIHRSPRQGVSLAEMSAAQRERAHDLLRASLSVKGYATSRDIMRLNHHLAELVSNFEEYGEHLYWFTVMGEPSATEPWGWQIDGHHLVINYFVLGDQVVMTPTFMGSEPVRATSGTYAGTAILETEQNQGLAFMAALAPEQQRAALIDATKRRGENLAEMFKDNVIVPYQGIAAKALSEAQRARLMTLIGFYVGAMDEGHAAIRLAEVRAHLADTHFAWKGGTGAGDVFYYRIQSPVIFIEFDHQGPIALAGPRDEATRNHIHTVVRTPNGNDYGKDLLRQHLAAHKNDPAHGHAPR